MSFEFNLSIIPRHAMTRNEFETTTPRCSIALDGMVSGGPFFNEATLHANFDHHDGVIREATMSTCMQVYFAIKGGLMESFRENGKPCLNVFINDTDQDTALAVWLLRNYKLFEGTQSIPHINRLLHLNNNWDITGGAFPINLDDKVIRQHCWIFEPYANLRKSGKLAQASEEMLRDNIESTTSRITAYLVGNASEKELDLRHEILYDSPRFKIIDEIGGNDVRYHLFSKGLNAFVSLVARRNDERFVYSIGRRSQYIPFPIDRFYDDLNEAEGLTRADGWNGSTIIGGSSRQQGSKLTWKEIAPILEARLSSN